MTVGELTAGHPSTLGALIKRKMLCIGCPAQDFHTIEDVARIYGIELGCLVEELQNAMPDRDAQRTGGDTASSLDTNVDVA